MKVYFISGLGADERVFYKILLPPAYEICHLKWKQPAAKETIEEYAIRMAEEINTNEPFSLVGLSMGGMIASEIAEKLHPAKTILISSYPSSLMFPALFSWAKQTKAYRFVPPAIFKRASIAKRFFTAEEAADKALIKQQIMDCDMDFLKWSIPAILNWKREQVPDNIFCIHGSRDEVLPMNRRVKNLFTVNKAGHMMVLTLSLIHI